MPRFPLFVVPAALCVALLGLAGCSASTARAASPAPEATPSIPASVKAAVAGTFPRTPEGDLLAYGRTILEKTPTVMSRNVRAGMSCEACHIDAGGKPHGLSMIGTAARFPQWNKRSHRFIMLQDRMAECFLYSMNGTPPAYNSREMIALTAYVTALSQGVPIMSEGVRGQELLAFAPPRAADRTAGARVYATSCQACHGADGSGNHGAFPPLWGPKSFNGGAGMHRLATMAEFVRYNMPYGSAPNTLSPQQAYDVAAYVLSHPRPALDKSRIIAFPGVRADRF